MKIRLLSKLIKYLAHMVNVQNKYKTRLLRKERK